MKPKHCVYCGKVKGLEQISRVEREDVEARAMGYTVYQLCFQCHKCDKLSIIITTEKVLAHIMD